jgi:hypothetical protein
MCPYNNLHLTKSRDFGANFTDAISKLESFRAKKNVLVNLDKLNGNVLGLIKQTFWRKFPLLVR